MPKKNTLNPILGGGSAIGLAFEDGVIIASDCLSSYGSMARFTNCPRVAKVNRDTIIGMSGDYGDFQHVMKSIEQKQIENESKMDGKNSGPLSLHSWLTRLSYNKRSEFKPYWVEWIVGGIQNGKPFLGYTDKLGTSHQDKAIATGSLGIIGLSFLRKYTENPEIKLNEQQAKELIIKALEANFYCDGYAINKFQLAIVTKDKPARVEEPFQIQENWKPALNILKLQNN